MGFYIQETGGEMTQDLAYRRTRRKHSPTEASIARASIVAEGGKPTKDAIADDSLSQRRNP